MSCYLLLIQIVRRVSCLAIVDLVRSKVVVASCFHCVVAMLDLVEGCFLCCVELTKRMLEIFVALEFVGGQNAEYVTVQGDGLFVVLGERFELLL